MSETPGSRWNHLKDLFGEAIAVAPALRTRWIAEACAGDPALRTEIEMLLAAHERADGFLDAPALAAPAAAKVMAEAAGFSLADRALPDRCGAYRIIRELGRGGMGVVYLGARDDDRFEKLAAIKVVSNDAVHPVLIQRFDDERRILASLDHPNIARLLDAGTTNAGVPYVVMEYVEGTTIDVYCSTRNFGVRERLALFGLVCAAVHYSHQHLVVHRDIKARNILVTADGVPKLLDFGIAKLIEPGGIDAHATRTVFRALTPESASPEQMRGEPVTVATDVYSLGVLLYRLLTGCSPYRGDMTTESGILHAICDEQPLRPSDAVESGARAVSGVPANSDLRGDLDLITLKALRKDRAQRYSSVEQLADDVARHLGGLPVLARPDTIRYRTGKFVRRHKASVAASALVVLSLVGGIIATAWEAHVAGLERSRAERRFNDVRRLAHTFMFDVHDAIATLPGSTSARRLLVTNALAYLDSLSGEVGTDVVLQRELATAYEKMADVLGRPNTPNLGDLPAALAAYRNAQAARARLLRTDPGNLDIQRDLSTTSLKMAHVLHYAGDVPAGVEEGRKSSVIEERLAASDRTPPQMFRLGKSYTSFGYLLGANGRTAESLDRMKLALAALEPLQASGWNSDEVQLQLALTYGYMADVLRMGAPVPGVVPNLRASLDMHQRAEAIDERLALASPLDTTRQRGLFVELIQVADVFDMLGEPRDALAHYRLGLAKAEGMSHADVANQQAQSDLALASTRLGTLLAKTGHPRQAVGLLDRAAKLLAPVVAVDATNVSTRSRVADYNVGFGFAHAAMAVNPGQDEGARLGHWLEAKARFQDGYAFWKEMRDRGVTTGEEAAKADDLTREIAKCDAAIGRRTGKP